MSAGGHLEEAILDLCRNNPDGLQDQDLEKELVGISVADRASAINSLLGKRRLELFRLGDKLVYKEVKAEDVAKLKGCTQEDLLVYQLIKNADTVGIWTKDLRMKSNLSQLAMAKVLKTLEGRKLIKAVKSVASKNRKVYMLYELEPSKELTGGAWYTEQEFDAAFIDVLRDHCLKFILHKGRVTLEEICEFVSATGMSKVELRPDDVLQVVHTLVFDGHIDSVEELTADNVRRPAGFRDRGFGMGYRCTFSWQDYADSVQEPVADDAPPVRPSATRRDRLLCGHFQDDELLRPRLRPVYQTLSGRKDEEVFYVSSTLQIPARSAFTSTPCGVCPVFHDCREGGLISPETCVYYSDWLAPLASMQW